MKEIVGKTPNGGVKAEIYYFDEKGNNSDENNYNYAVIRELDEKGNLVNETYSYKNSQKEDVVVEENLITNYDESWRNPEIGEKNLKKCQEKIVEDNKEYIITYLDKNYFPTTKEKALYRKKELLNFTDSHNNNKIKK